MLLLVKGEVIVWAHNSVLEKTPETSALVLTVALQNIILNHLQKGCVSKDGHFTAGSSAETTLSILATLLRK